MSGPVKWFTFEDFGAPELNNQQGDLINVLDACLITGLGVQTIHSITIENGVAVATFNSAHRLNQFQVVELSGASSNILNAEFKILGLTFNTIEFLVDLPDQVIAENISCRLAPLGWSKLFNGNQKAVYQAKNSERNPYFFRIDDNRDTAYSASYAKFAKVGILESCNDIDDLTGVQAPFDPGNPNKNWTSTGSGSTVISGWFKWYYAVANNAATSTGIYESYGVTSGAREWLLVGDDDTFYILPNFTVGGNGYSLYGFGVVENPNIGNFLPFLSASNRNFSAGTALSITSALGSLSDLAMIKNDSNAYQNTVFGSVKLPFGIASAGSYNTFKHGNGYDFLFGPFYMIDNENSFVGEFPILLCSLYQNANIADRVPIIDNGRALMKLTFRPDRNLTGRLWFDLGGVN
ncbi:hypothetical protein [Acinetobacter sp. YH01020]|uniref:hypothetical protein n=1 Tax=Acinetobacter sp. YH01020 TaxID=2601034 RepID=UPI0015D27711|nr:hypothetical protein [Acinetobacter sp. YH01020]